MADCIWRFIQMTRINIYSKEQVDALLGIPNVSLRTPSNDWTDLFDDVEENNTHYLVAKKDIFIAVDTAIANEESFYYIPKGFKDTQVRISRYPIYETANSRFDYEIFYTIFYTSIPDTVTTIDATIKYLSASVVSGTNDVAISSNTTTSTIAKSNFVIYTR